MVGVMKNGSGPTVINHSWQETELSRFESDQTRFRTKLNYTFRF
jgi:hypothetical protein